MANAQEIADAVAALIATGKEIQNERKRLENWTPAELRELAVLACEAAAPENVQAKVIMRPTRVKL